MVFSSWLFLFYFLPASLVLYYAAPRRGRHLVLTIASYVFLLGDSFTNIYSLASMRWGDAAGFAEHLALALGRPVDRIVQNDAGAYATREQ